MPLYVVPTYQPSTFYTYDLISRILLLYSLLLSRYVVDTSLIFLLFVVSAYLYVPTVAILLLFLLYAVLIGLLSECVVPILPTKLSALRSVNKVSNLISMGEQLTQSW